VIDGAMGLFANFPVEEVTVLDIAGAVDMTPAAVYYHFASKEQILLEGLQAFCDQMLAEVRTHLPVKDDRDGVRNLVAHMLAWNHRNRTSAVVYFVNSIGLNLLVEALRRRNRLELVALLRQAAKASRGRLGGAEAGVIAVALVSLIETATASMLNQDAAFLGLGSRRFVEAVKQLSDRIAGLDSAK
jgi:AcrR family transcriptional regulator